MASLPSVALKASLKLESEIRKDSASPEKNPNVSYPRNPTATQFDAALESTRPPDVQEALSVIADGMRIESTCYVPLLQECIEKSSLSNAKAAHAHIIKTGTHEDFFVATFLINVYAKCGAMDDARKVFDWLPRQNVVAWTSLMTGYVQNSQPELTIRVFQEMLERGSFPTNFTLGAAVNACSSLDSLELGKQIHAYAIKYGIEHDASVGNSLCSFYSSFGQLRSALIAFDKIAVKNIVSWTAAISACGDNGKAAKGLRYYTDMLCEGIEPNEFTLTTVLSLCSTLTYLGIGSQCHSMCIKLGHGSNLRVRNSLMYLYLKRGRIKEAERLFSDMEDCSLVTWNALIAGHAQMMDLAKDDISAHWSGIEALNIYSKLNTSGMKPDIYTFSSVLTACSGLVALEQGEQVHAQALKTGFLSDVVVRTALISMYNKCGSVEQASKAFLEMSMRTLISWTSMINGYANHGQTERALQLFEDMRVTGVRPNQITFVGVLSACSRAGMMEEALNYFELMRNVYKIKPLMDHCGCVVEAYVRLGRLEEAFEFVEKKMELEPKEFIWSLLLSGCKTRGERELGLYAAEQLLKLKPKGAETYLQILNMYSSAEKFDEASTVREQMEEDKIARVEDCSWISLKGKIHSFKLDDWSDPHSREISTSLEHLLEKAKSHGLEIKNERLGLVSKDENAKTSSAKSYQTEAMAIAFGLLNTPRAAPIRVIKSIGMSKDGHGFIKLVSELTGRTIVVRDSKRLHRFENGQCSCGDFPGLI